MSGPSLDELTTHADGLVRHRARLVRDTLALGPTRAAREHGVTRQTAAKWATRYRKGGATQLLHPVRQQRTMNDLQRAALTAPLWMPTTKWSSRSIAEALGVSQSSVARAWEPMKSSTQLTDDLARRAQGAQPGFLGLLVTSGYSVLVFQLARRDTPLTHTGPGERRSLRTVLAADLIRPQIPEGRAGDIRSFWARVSRTVDATVVAIASDTAPIPTGIDFRLTCRNPDEWLSLFPLLSTWGAIGPVHEVETELRTWAAAPRRPFVWVAGAVASGTAATPLSARHRGSDGALAGEIIAAIRNGIADGRLAPGDRVTERYLAGQLHTTRNQVRTAIRALESEGLLTTTTGRAAVVPVPTTSDVVEIYAARRALGAMVLRAATRWSPEGRRSVCQALDRLREHTRAQNAPAIPESDIAFQDAVGRASGLIRIAPMLQVLADHLRMLITVMGLDYAYPISGVLADDEQIFAAVDAGDGDLAATLWQRKMDDARAYMLGQLTSTAHRR
jgi:DNA-binding GntR family transcriptional regulator